MSKSVLLPTIARTMSFGEFVITSSAHDFKISNDNF